MASTNRAMPRGNWTYDWARFPAAWFGANWSGFESERQLETFGNYSLVMFGWQAMQGPTNYSHTLTAQVEQARRVKERYPWMPTVVYMPSDGASPLFDAMLPLFEDWDRYRGFFYLDGAGASYSTRYKCAIGTTHSGADNGRKAKGCEVIDWNFNFYNASAREYYLEVVLKKVVELDPDNRAFDGIFFDAAMGFMRKTSCPEHDESRDRRHRDRAPPADGDERRKVDRAGQVPDLQRALRWHALPRRHGALRGRDRWRDRQRGRHDALLRWRRAAQRRLGLLLPHR